jgi:peptidyl-dipeptidase Dcp
VKALPLLFCLFLVVITGIAGQSQNNMSSNNPFFLEYKTPFQAPPFDLIKIEHFIPAYKRGMEEQKTEIAVIINNSFSPTFDNTILALERSGVLLSKVDRVFNALNGANTNDDIQKIDEEITPLLTKHGDDINLNEKLFQRVKVIFDNIDNLSLTPEQRKLTEETYKGFVRGGANLTGASKERFRKLNEELSMLSLKFGNNVLKETNSFKMIIEKKEDLAGLPQSSIDAASESAKKAGIDGKWVFTVHKPSMIPFLQYAQNRALREKIFKAYINRSDNNNEFDNKEIVAKIAALRVERANILGFKTHADFVLERNMAKTPQAVYDFMNKIWDPALKSAKNEINEMQKIIAAEGGKFKLEPWDWWYYAEKVRKAKYDLDENELRPYFLLENVRKGAFDVASKLYGIQFVERNDIPKYVDEAKVFEVKRSDGSHIGIFYSDYFPRPGKRAGAWMSALRTQHRLGDSMVTPIIYNVGNFSRPTGDKPSLLSYEEVKTLFHEFGHALHGLLSNVTFESLAGTAVPRDFVELPSQIMEHWASEPEVLKSYARHYKTGEPIPQEMIDKIQKSSKFNQGFITVEYLSAAFLDMDWHTLTNITSINTSMFEKESLSKIGLIPEIVVRYRSPYFAHIFSGGYSAGYYSYLWAEVLDSDAFEAFKEKGIFDQATAQAFLKNILERGGTDDPMKLYVQFRGRKPAIEALLRNRGLINENAKTLK